MRGLRERETKILSLLLLRDLLLFLSNFSNIDFGGRVARGERVALSHQGTAIKATNKSLGEGRMSFETKDEAE